MKALVLTDVHAEEYLLEKLPPLIKEHGVDAVILLGDITHNGPLVFAKEFLDTLESTGVKVFGVYGNMDNAQVAKMLEERGVSIHAKAIEFNGFRFIGFGGGPPSIFNTPSEASDDEFYKILCNFEMDDKTVLVTHAPPKGCDMAVTGTRRDIGSAGLRRIIDEKQPLADLCGHVHEKQGEEMIGKTKIIKVGAAKNGNTAIVKFSSEGASARFIKLI